MEASISGSGHADPVEEEEVYEEYEEVEDDGALGYDILQGEVGEEIAVEEDEDEEEHRKAASQHQRKSVVGKFEDDDDEDGFEDMEEDEEFFHSGLGLTVIPTIDVDEIEAATFIEDEPHLRHRPTVLGGRHMYDTDWKNAQSARQKCLMCGRSASQKIRLFRWPRNEIKKRRWAMCFGIHDKDPRIALMDKALICSYHFDTSAFLYTGTNPTTMDFFWSTEAIPRYPFRRPPHADPFPWEPRNEFRYEPSAPRNQYVINFRRSNFRVKNNKTTHDVALISPHGSPHIQYEFSFNRNSTTDTGKFYSCLGCRKAKSETKDKDNIRTIKLIGSRLMSKNDPLSGHHHACRPTYIPMRRLMRREDELQGAGQYEVDEEGRAVYDNRGVKMEPGRGARHSDPSSKIVYVDEHSAFNDVSGAEVEVREGGQWATVEEMDRGGPSGGEATVYYAEETRPRGEENVDRSQHPLDPSPFVERRIERREEQRQGGSAIEGALRRAAREREEREAWRTGLRAQAVRKRAWMSSGVPSPLLRAHSAPHCHLCMKVLPTTEALVSHLHAHLADAPMCTLCGRRIDPSTHRSQQRSGMCVDCAPPRLKRRGLID